MGDRKESNTLLQARYSFRRLLRHGKYILGHDPTLLPILLRLTPMGTSRKITDLTQLVVEGFPRGGNTFTVFALQNAAHNQLRISSHVHHPSQVKLAVERGVPTVLVVREPIAVLSSYLTYGQHGRASDVFKEYSSYHRELIPYVDQVLVCEFEEIVSDMTSVIARINHRFSTEIPPFDQSPTNVDAVFAEIARQHGLLHPNLDPDQVAPRPSVARREISEGYRLELLDPRRSTLRNEALNLFSYFSGKAAEQRALFADVSPKRQMSSSTRKSPPMKAAPADEGKLRSSG
jgi:hypothetical protein